MPSKLPEALTILWIPQVLKGLVMMAVNWYLEPQRSNLILSSIVKSRKKWNVTSTSLLLPCIIGFLDNLIVELSQNITTHLFVEDQVFQESNASIYIDMHKTSNYELNLSSWKSDYRLFLQKPGYNTWTKQKHIPWCASSVLHNSCIIANRVGYQLFSILSVKDSQLNSPFYVTKDSLYSLFGAAQLAFPWSD